MKYKVEVTDDVLKHIRDYARHIAIEQHAPENASAWLERLWGAIDGLCDWPMRSPVAEPETSALGFEVRKHIFGEHLIFYRIDERQVLTEVLSFQHGPRRKKC